MKQPYAKFHVTQDDINVRLSNVRLREEPRNGPPEVPVRTASQRATWPTTTREKKTGSYMFDVTPTLVRTPWELDRSRRPVSQYSYISQQRPLPKRIFEQLPREIFHCILDHLEGLHSTQSAVEVKQLYFSLRSLLFVDKRWHRVAREHLYRELWLPSNEGLPRRKFSFSRPLSRLKLLWRTLSTSPGLAQLVRHVRVTALLADELQHRPARAKKDPTHELLADILNGCPNLEIFTGYVPTAGETVSISVLAALTSSRRLKAHAWLLGTDAAQNFAGGEMVQCHDRWQQLQTLAINARQTQHLGPGMVSMMIQHLPSLRHLFLRNLLREDFHNGTLLSLPALRSLRLEDMEGLTDQGVEQLAHGRLALSLEKLCMVDLELTSLRTVQTLLSHMHRLRSFTMVQNTSPEFLFGVQSHIANAQLESASLQYLHWDALIPGSATKIFANSIASGHFPSLRRVKVPCDYDGAIQPLCRPIAQENLSAHDLELLDRFNAHDSRYERFLRLSQIQAQLRVRESRQQPSFNVIVQDEDDTVRLSRVIGSYVGSMDSRIEYSLEPDVASSFYALAMFEDVEVPKCLEMEEDPLFVREEQLLNLSTLF